MPKPELKVCSQQCNQCLFSENRIVDKDQAAEIIQHCVSKDEWFECHKGTIADQRLVCKGFWDAYKLAVWPLRMALAYPQYINYIDPEAL